MDNYIVIKKPNGKFPFRIFISDKLIMDEDVITQLSAKSFFQENSIQHAVSIYLKHNFTRVSPQVKEIEQCKLFIAMRELLEEYISKAQVHDESYFFPSMGDEGEIHRFFRSYLESADENEIGTLASIFQENKIFFYNEYFN